MPVIITRALRAATPSTYRLLPYPISMSATAQGNRSFSSMASLSSKLFAAQFTDGWVNGEWVPKSKKFDVKDPASGEVVSRVSCLDAGDAARAIDAAQAAFEVWRQKSVKHRHDVLLKWFTLIHEHRQQLAELISLENGKTLQDAINETDYAASFVEWFAEEGRRQYGDVLCSPFSSAHTLEMLRLPVGVSSLITPWNFPAAMITRKAAAALAAGCTVVVKPGEDTPLTALALAQLAHDAGLPRGVLNVVPCDRETVAEVGNELATNAKVKKISLTGSTSVGKGLMRLAADSVKRISMELGGNAPFIVFEDADIDRAVESAVVCKYRHSGQTCVCANRLYIHESVWDEFVEKFKKKVEVLKVGHGLVKGSTMGPLINERILQKVENLVNDAVDKGAKVITGGGRPKNLPAELKAGTFFMPTILDCRGLDLLSSSEAPQIVLEEIFGPVAPLYSFQDELEVLERANRLNTGRLAGYVFSRSHDRLNRLKRNLQVGMIGANTASFSCAEIPFGGLEESGLGREGSKYGIEEYTYMKAISSVPL